MKRQHDISHAFGRLMMLFEEDLEGVAFPLVDLDVLRAASSRWETQQQALVDAEAQVQSAREKLDQAGSELSALSQKAVAYIRVFAADDVDLVAKLDALELKKRRVAKRGGAEKSKAKLRPGAVDAAAPDLRSVAKAS